ncbi:uncharacterized protein LOC109827596 [Asparagus officinalis]|uniref:uncharacterized protein LOC109827596 n=1 Tax=Asparagus officinalis TaxID=4686 RepID=UPI00098E3ADC|nr:uncharacterized protein LOC109827596 [Asparagus officinalis]
METDKNVDENDGGDIDSAESEEVESHKSPVGSDDDELFEIRQRNKKILEEEKGRIAFNAGARLVDDVDGPPPTVNEAQPEPQPQQANEVNTSSTPIHDTDAGNIPSHIEESHMSHIVGLNVVGPNSRGTIPKTQNWPSFWTYYEGGYQSDQRSSNDEEPLFDSDHEAPEINMKKKKKERVNYKYFNERVDMKAVHFEPGLKFTSRSVLKEAILNYSIQQHYDLVYMKNDTKRIHMGCSLCFWQMTAGPDCHEAGVWQIKFINHDHTCCRTFKNRLITDNWIAHVYLDKILRDPKMKPSNIVSDIYENFQINVTLKKCRRGKEKALNAVQGLMQRQYGLLKPYMKELMRSNVGTTCVLKVAEGEAGQPSTFLRFYVCFEALKMGFTLGCRRIFGLDEF